MRLAILQLELEEMDLNLTARNRTNRCFGGVELARTQERRRGREVYGGVDAFSNAGLPTSTRQEQEPRAYVVGSRG